MWTIRLICLAAIIAAALLNGGWSGLDVVYGGWTTLRHMMF